MEQNKDDPSTSVSYLKQNLKKYLLKIKTVGDETTWIEKFLSYWINNYNSFTTAAHLSNIILKPLR